ERGLEEDVKTIVLKALARDRDARYASAAAFADDVQRFLRCEPIAARPPSALYHLRTFVRRNRLLAGSVVALFLALAMVGVAAVWGYVAVERKNEVVEWQNAFLTGLLTEADPSVGDGPQVTLGEVVRRAADRLDEDPPPPAVEVGLRWRLGEVLLRVGDPGLAARHLDRAVRLEERLGREGTADALGGRLRWIQALLESGDVDAAEQRTLELVADATRVLGAEHRYVVGARVALGQIAAARGRYAEARGLFFAATEWRRSHLGPDDLATVQAESNLAAAEYELGHHAEAAARFAHVLEVRTRVAGRDHP